MTRSQLAGAGLFQSTLSVRRATRTGYSSFNDMLFQSTLSVRRATSEADLYQSLCKISIHALREESDTDRFRGTHRREISIHALREESDSCIRRIWQEGGISIHALREESDETRSTSTSARSKFQSTLSVRRATQATMRTYGGDHISIHALREESDLRRLLM